ncbi:hypothetical protein VP01_51g6 [Puccinia sorghi]|uniref:Uncharacterized protein n=1 Tax=Puccinia sorghi TaxID=27349 RepID=A0A0L6UKN8_9BASI|nr:hypothetical protein VP01_51g6 [Puccinia sorghi]
MVSSPPTQQSFVTAPPDTSPPTSPSLSTEHPAIQRHPVWDCVPQDLPAPKNISSDIDPANIIAGKRRTHFAKDFDPLSFLGLKSKQWLLWMLNFGLDQFRMSWMPFNVFVSGKLFPSSHDSS